MNWTQAAIHTTTYGIDHITGALLALGINGFEIEDSADFEEFLQGTEIHWDYVDQELMKLKNCETKVKIYIPDNSQGAETLAAVKAVLKQLKSDDKENLLGSLVLDCGNIREEDWENNWKQYFKPFEIGERLAIKPSWESYENKSNRIVLEIDPGSSFGTGQHYTTQLCIEQLEKHIFNGCTVLDLGCGSGILSIAAILLGASSAVGIDIDQNAVGIAIENAAKNNIGPDKFTGICGNVIDDIALREKIAENKYDVIAANIVADVIIAMSGFISSYIKPHGVLICSGIINTRYKEVQTALEKAGFFITDKNEKNDWVELTCRLK